MTIPKYIHGKTDRPLWSQFGFGRVIEFGWSLKGRQTHVRESTRNA